MSYPKKITCPYCMESFKNPIIKVKDGTANYLMDGGDNKIYDGAIFSNDTLRLKGNGELYITANNAHLSISTN